MKKLENILLKACGFSILILTLFYAFASFGNLNDQKIGFSTFAVIFVFGIIISLTTLILGLKKPALPIRLAIHYASLLVAFCVIFIATGNIQADSPAKIFSAVIIFTVLYILLFAVVYFIKRIVNTVDKQIDKKNKGAKPTYKSLYK